MFVDKELHDALRHLVKRHGLGGVVDGLIELCGDKAEERDNNNDYHGRDNWRNAAYLLEDAAGFKSVRDAR